MKKSLKCLCTALLIIFGGSLFSSVPKESTAMERKSIRPAPRWDEVFSNLDMLVRGVTPEGINTCLKKRYLRLQGKIMLAAVGITWKASDELYSGLSQDLQIALVSLSSQMYLGVLRINLDGCLPVFTGRSFTGGVGILSGVKSQ